MHIITALATSIPKNGKKSAIFFTFIKLPLAYISTYHLRLGSVLFVDAGFTVDFAVEEDLDTVPVFPAAEVVFTPDAADGFAFAVFAPVEPLLVTGLDAGDEGAGLTVGFCGVTRVVCDVSVAVSFAALVVEIPVTPAAVGFSRFSAFAVFAFAVFSFFAAPSFLNRNVRTDGTK